MIYGLVLCHVFCEESPAIRPFLFTGDATPDVTVEEQILWGLTLL